jgi:hypothetical protein
MAFLYIQLLIFAAVSGRQTDARKAQMVHRRNRLNWLYDNDLQQFTIPCGRVITLTEIAQLLQDQVANHHDFAGPWTGWRMRQNRIIPPGVTFRQSRITAENLRAFNRWLASFEAEQYLLPLDTSQRMPTDHQLPEKESHPHTSPPEGRPAAQATAAEPSPPYEARRVVLKKPALLPKPSIRRSAWKRRTRKNFAPCQSRGSSRD